MSLGTYADLQAAIANHLHRTDLALVIPDLIVMCEENMSADIVSRAMDVKTNLVCVAGVSTVALPTDMVDIRRLQIRQDYNTVLKYASPDELSDDFNQNLQGVPQVFTVVGGNIELAPIPAAAYTLEITYKQRIPALTNSNTTNWVLTSWPSAYLYGSLMAAQPYIQNDARMQTYMGLYKEAVNNINAVEWYSGSTMRVRAK